MEDKNCRKKSAGTLLRVPIFLFQPLFLTGLERTNNKNNNNNGANHHDCDAKIRKSQNNLFHLI